MRDIEAKIFLAKAEMDKANAEMDKAKADVDKAKADVDKEKVFKTNAEFVDNFEEKVIKAKEELSASLNFAIDSA